MQRAAKDIFPHAHPGGAHEMRNEFAEEFLPVFMSPALARL
jgi:hypothetical protein